MKRDSENLEMLIEQGQHLFLPNLSVDIVIFGYQERSLKVLLLEITEGRWMLPGGYVLQEEDLNESAQRVLKERSGLENVYLKQFYTFGNSQRSFSTEIKKLFESSNLPWKEELWINQRFVSTGYYALVQLEESKPVAGIFARNFAWFSLDALPELLLDHHEIIEKAHQEFRMDLKVHPVAFHLLPKKFTMPELHRVFETVLQRKMDRSRFQKKMFEYNVFKRLDERREAVPHKRPYLYSYEN